MLSVTKSTLDDALPFSRLVNPDLDRFKEQFTNLLGARGFPGSLCVSIERSNFPMIKSEPYWVCEKSDGTRFLMCVMRMNGLKLVTLVGRRDDHVYVTFMNHVPRPMYEGTIFDGEIAIDPHTKKVHYLIFDAMFVNGRDVRSFPFSHRYREVCQALVHYRPHDKDAFEIKIKTFFPLSRVAECMSPEWDHVRSRYGYDGLVLTPESCPVIAGRNYKMFKWKNGMLHTVDFLVSEDGMGLQVRDRGGFVTVGKSDMRLAPGSIVECALDDFAKGVWGILRQRTDKTYPNDMLTFEKTLLNIQENIQWQEFIF